MCHHDDGASSQMCVRETNTHTHTHTHTAAAADQTYHPPCGEFLDTRTESD